MSATENLVWKTPLPPGYSSPVLSRTSVFLTARDKDVLYTIAIDRATGKELWRRESAQAPKPASPTRLAVSAPSPATDGSNAYVLFDEFGLISYDASGNERWRKPLAPFNTPYGFGSSPVIEGKILILAVDCDTDSYLLALDKDTGREMWKTPRPEATHGYPTPVAYRPSRGPAQLLLSGSFRLTSYRLETGEPLWWVDGMAWQAKSVPVVGDGLVFVHSSMPTMQELGPMPAEKTLAELLAKHDANKDGKLTRQEAPDNDIKKLWFLFDVNGDGILDEREFNLFQARNTAKSGFYAIKPGQRGDATGNIVWRYDKGLPNIPSPLLYNAVLYLLREGGILTAFEPATGKILKQGRVEGALGAYFASPVAADGKLYLLSKDGDLAVLRAGGDWEVLTVNKLGEDSWATPAIGGGAVYVRTQQALYCFRSARG
jgi:outer membrane protein assembly factor BamB